MKDGYLAIGEVSEITGITVKALRYYDRIGLFRPSYKDPFSKYRYYSTEQFAQLDIIKATRSLGISPNDIKILLAKKDNDELIQFLNYHKTKLLNEIEDLQNTVNTINEIQDNILSSIETANNREVYYKDIPARNIIKSRIKSTNEEDVRIAYAKLYMNVERLCHNTYETGIIYSNINGAEFHPTDIFAVIRQDVVIDPPELETLPAGRYLCVCFNKDNAQQQAERFNEYICRENLEPSYVLQVDLLNYIFDQRESYIELQALV